MKCMKTLTAHKMLYGTTKMLWCSKCCVRFKADVKLLLF